MGWAGKAVTEACLCFPAGSRSFSELREFGVFAKIPLVKRDVETYPDRLPGHKG